MANLIIDIGNTAAKYAIFDAGKCIWHTAANKETLEPLEYASTLNIERAIISSVSTTGDKLHKALKNLPYPTIQLDTETPLPFALADYIPNTLGADRIAAVAGALTLVKSKNFLVVDMGTCITYEVIQNNTYIGGNISPGINMRFMAMHEHTTLLPLIEFNNEWPPLWGVDTYSALAAGVIWGIKGEVEGYIHELKQQIPNMEVILTGGNSHLISEKMDESIMQDSLLVEKGLNYILEYNTQHA